MPNGMQNRTNRIEGLTFAEIAIVMHISETRASQIHARAISKIRNNKVAKRFLADFLPCNGKPVDRDIIVSPAKSMRPGLDCFDEQQ